MSVVRSTNQWREILAPLSTSEAALRIFGDLTDYPMHGRHLADDKAQLAHALTAWAEIRLQDEIPNKIAARS